MKPSLSSILVARIMRDFAQRTGLDPVAREPQRYLWTDAFAVCNFLELYNQTEEEIWCDLALRLVDQVHHILGRHRRDDPRCGWISGLSEAEGELHPTRGGLRIGKLLNERSIGGPPNERGEWDRDGQYYHYLTKWMHALNRVSRITGDPSYAVWGRELAQTAHERFSYVPALGGAKRLYWKMSIDLCRPQVLSMGQHDPLDGLVTYSELQAAAGPARAGLPPLQSGVADLTELCRRQEWETDDPLGIGGMLCDASRVAQLVATGNRDLAGLLGKVLDAALKGLDLFMAGATLKEPAGKRLAFRELGLCIGLHGAGQADGIVQGNPGLFPAHDTLTGQLAALEHYLPLGERIESFWMEDGNRSAPSWSEHREINMVMLATSLAPGVFLGV